jgi:hypothetical protein
MLQFTMKKKGSRRIFVELFAIFIGVLSAITSDRIIQHHVESNQYKETLRSLQKEIKSDIVSLRSEIKSPYRKSKVLISKRFRFWLQDGDIPKDSFQLLLDQMLHYELPSNIINFKVLQINQGIDRISDLDLKRLIYEYYTDAETTDRYHERMSAENMNIILKEYDIRNFAPGMSNTFRNQFISTEKIDKEIINRVLLYENQISELEQVLLVQELKANTILSIIAEEIE